MTDASLIPETDIQWSMTPQPGGQHVGSWQSITLCHWPSGITIIVNSERSSHRNKRVAMDALLGALTSPHYGTRMT